MLARFAKLAGCSASLVCAASYLLVNATFQPGDGWGRTVVGECVKSLVLGQARRITCIIPCPYFVEKDTSGTWHCLAGYRYEASDFPHATECVVTCTDTWNEAGIWSPVSRTESRRIRVDNPDGSVPKLSQSDGVAMLASIDAANPGVFPPSTRAQDAAGGQSTTRVLWFGVANDCSVLAAFAVLVGGTAHRVAARRRSQEGTCPSCRYDLSGLAEGRCPECGTTFDGRTNCSQD